MRGCRISLVFLAILLPVATVAGCSFEPDATVLFVGNSYTSSNGLPDVVREMAASSGQDLEVAVQAPGGWWLKDHAGSDDTLSAIADGEFDYVVLQEQSMVPAVRDLADGESRPAAVSLANEAAQTGAAVVLFMTWGHRNGSSEVGHSSYESMQVAIANTYGRLSAATTAETAPVGAAWWIALHERPDIGLYQPDGSHPSAAGSYLAAAVIAGTLTGADPIEFDHDGGLDSDVAAALRQFASRALGGEPWG